jgi:hypothetical protein
MRLVVIESPFQAHGAETEEARARGIARNMRYLNRCILDCLRRGESPYASHLMLTGALNDLDPAERKTGIEAGFKWRRAAHATVIYTDHGISHGMKLGIEDAQREQDRRYRAFESPHGVEYRQIGAEPEDPA